MHKAPEWSQLNKTNTGALERNGPIGQTRPVERPHIARNDAPERMISQGRKQKMGHPNVHKAPRWSQLSKIDTGALEQNGAT